MKLLMITFLLAVSFIAASLDCLYAANPDRLYKDGRFKDAQSAYEKLDIEHPKDISYRYNKGCAAYQVKDYKTAQAAFASVYQRTTDNDMRFRAVYNLGNTAFQGGDMQSAASFYKEALRMNPQSIDARYNLELALRKIKEEEEKKKQEQQQKQQDNKQQNQQANDNKGNEQQQKDQKQQDKKDDEQNKDQNNKQQGKGKDQKQQQQQQNPQNLSGELKALNQPEQNKGEMNNSKQHQAMTPDKAKAEALIGNIQEDRSRFLQHQAPDDSQAGKSGKYW